MDIKETLRLMTFHSKMVHVVVSLLEVFPFCFMRKVFVSSTLSFRRKCFILYVHVNSGEILRPIPHLELCGIYVFLTLKVNWHSI